MIRTFIPPAQLASVVDNIGMPTQCRHEVVAEARLNIRDVTQAELDAGIAKFMHELDIERQPPAPAAR